jgi:hypothetical protein
MSKGDTIGLLVAAARATMPAGDGTVLESMSAGHATITIPAPPSLNRTTGGNRHAQRKRKAKLEQDLTIALLSRDVPRPIPGDSVRVSALLAFPTTRRRDEGNYRGGDAGLEKCLGDALDPHDRNAPFRWLSDDSPEHYTFGELRFEVVPGVRAGGLCKLRLEWGDRRRLVVIAPNAEQARLWLREQGVNPSRATLATCPRALELALRGLTAERNRVVVVNEWPGLGRTEEGFAAELWARRYLELHGIPLERVRT